MGLFANNIRGLLFLCNKFFTNRGSKSIFSFPPKKKGMQNIQRRRAYTRQPEGAQFVRNIDTCLGSCRESARSACALLALISV